MNENCYFYFITDGSEKGKFIVHRIDVVNKDMLKNFRNILLECNDSKKYFGSELFFTSLLGETSDKLGMNKKFFNDNREMLKTFKTSQLFAICLEEALSCSLNGEFFEDPIAYALGDGLLTHKEVIELSAQELNSSKLVLSFGSPLDLYTSALAHCYFKKGGVLSHSLEQSVLKHKGLKLVRGKR